MYPTYVQQQYAPNTCIHKSDISEEGNTAAVIFSQLLYRPTLSNSGVGVAMSFQQYYLLRMIYLSIRFFLLFVSVNHFYSRCAF